MKNFKIAGLVCLCFVLGMALVGCGGSSEAPASSGAQEAAGTKLDFKLGSNTADNQVFTVTLQWVIDELKAKTNGNFNIAFFPNNVLGMELEMRDMVAEGTLELANLGMGGLAAWEQAVDLINFLYVFRSIEEMYYICIESPFGRKYFYDNILKEKNVRMLEQWAATPRQLIATKPIKTTRDLQNLKLRMPAGILTFEKSWKALGAMVVQIPLGDAFTALQQGTIDALEMPIDFMYNYQLQEYCKNLTNTNHVIYSQVNLINEDAWKKIPADYQKILQDLMTEGRRRVDVGNTEAVTRLEKDMKEKYQVQFIDLDENTRNEFESITNKVMLENAGVMFDQTRYDDLQAALTEYRGRK